MKRMTCRGQRVAVGIFFFYQFNQIFQHLPKTQAMQKAY